MLFILFNICSSLITSKVNVNECTFSGSGVLTRDDVTKSGSFSSYTKIILEEGITEVESNSFYECRELQYIAIPNSCTIITGTSMFRCLKLKGFIINDDHPTHSVDEQGGLYNKNKSILYRIPGSLSSFTIPSTVKIIAIRSMNGNLKSIHIPNSVETIEKNACNEMGPMERITFEEGSRLKTITTESFWYSSAIEFHIPPSVEVIETNAMKEAKIKQLIFDDIENSNLTTISSNAFLGFLGDTITLPPTVQTIQSYAFGSCLNLVSITIPRDCSDLDTNAFSGSSKISTVTVSSGNQHYVSLNNTLYSIDKKNLILVPGSLESFTIPKELEKLGSGILQSKKSLTEIIVEGGEVFSARDGVLYDYKNKTLIAVAGGVTKVSCLLTVTTINGGAMSGVAIKEFIFESNETLTTTGDSSFKGCSIESIVIPRTLTDIWYYCFQDCVNLSSVIFCPNSNLQRIRDAAFMNTKITEIEFPASLKGIYPEAFRSTSLRTVSFETGKTSNLIQILKSAFYNCPYLVSFTIPKTVTTLGNSVFQDCPKYIPDFEASSGLLLIPDFAFYKDTFTSITIPPNVNSIGISAFSGCSNLETVDFSQCTNLTLFTSECFANCVSLTTITLPLDLESVESSAFIGCTRLITINAHPSSTKLVTYDSILYTIGHVKLLICPAGRTDARVHSKTHEMGSNAFKNCSVLKSVQFELASEMEVLGENTFYGCCALLSIGLPDSVTSIEANCFLGCTSLSSVTFPRNSKLSSLGTSVFTGCTSLESVDFGTNSSLLEIGSRAFAGCGRLKTLSAPERLQTIGESAFQGTALSSFSFGSSVDKIGASAFADCGALSSVKFANGIAEIPDSLFEGCASLSECALPMTATRIGVNAFRGTSLTSVRLGDALSSLGEGAFLDCPKLSIVTYCGRNKIGAVNAFPSAVSVRVVLGYPYATIANRKVEKVLTPECLPMPTATGDFTHGLEGKINSIAMLVVAMNDDTE